MLPDGSLNQAMDGPVFGPPLRIIPFSSCLGGILTSPKNKKDSFDKKWSPTIGLFGHTSIPNLLLEYQKQLKITAPELRTLLALLSHKWNVDEPWPSNATISLRANCSPRTVRKHTASMEAKGVLKRLSGIHPSNVFDLSALKFKLEELAINDPRYGQKESSARLKSTGVEGSILTPKEDTVKEDSLIIHSNNLKVSNDNLEFTDNEVNSIYDYYLKCFNKEPYQCQLNDKRKSMIKLRLNDCGKDMLMKAIETVSLNEWYMGANDHGFKADLDYILKSYDNVEKMTNLIISERLESHRKMRAFSMTKFLEAQEDRY